MPVIDYILRLLVALACGLAIGLERQYSRQMAGIRTNALIGLGACVYTLVPFFMEGGDPLRVAAQIVTGIGFLGGGVIVRDGFTIKGLTTAATMWCTAAVGMVAGGGFLWQAAAAAGIIVLVNFALHPISNYLRNVRSPKAHTNHQYRLFVSCEAEQQAMLRTMLCSLCQGSPLQFTGLDMLTYSPEHSAGFRLLLDSDRPQTGEIERLMTAALSLPGVVSASWQVNSADEG